MRHHALALLGLLLAGAAAAQLDTAGDVAIEDVLEVMLLDRDVIAIDANGGGQTVERLELGENVTWRRSRGRVGIVLTDRRVLAAGTGSSFWQSERYRRTEQPPTSALLGDRVALLTTRERALGFTSEGGNIIEEEIGPNEQILTRRVGKNVAVLVTSRRALGLTPFLGGFFPIKLDLRERIESLEAVSNVATLTTQRRVLIFRANTGTWEERRRELRR